MAAHAHSDIQGSKNLGGTDNFVLIRVYFLDWIDSWMWRHQPGYCLSEWDFVTSI